MLFSDIKKGTTGSLHEERSNSLWFVPLFTPDHAHNYYERMIGKHYFLLVMETEIVKMICANAKSHER